MNLVKTKWHWDEKKIKESSPEELIENIKGYTEYINGLIVEERMKKPTTKEFTKFLEDILTNHWGPWSSSMNKVIRSRVKETDKFAIENDQMRFLGKKLSTVYLYWCKCHGYLQSTFTENVIASSFPIAKAFGEMEVVYNYFCNLKFTATPTFLKENENGEN